LKVIKVSSLVKNYGNTKAVRDISFSVSKGEIFGIVGPNGAGKTTTIECMIGLKKPSSGSITVLEINPSKQRSDLFERIGVQLQEASYQNKIKVWELCQMYSSIYKNPIDYEVLLEKLDIADKRNSYYGNLSGGQKQKISILLALLHNPEIVFLDELTTGLDPKSRRTMWEYIKKLKADGRTVILTTHYMEEAEQLCDELCIVDQGKIVAIGSVAEVIDSCSLDIVTSFNSENEDLETLISSVDHVKGVERLNGTYNVYCSNERAISLIICLMEERKVSYTNLNITRPTLEDAYIKLTGNVIKEDGNV